MLKRIFIGLVLVGLVLTSCSSSIGGMGITRLNLASDVYDEDGSIKVPEGNWSEDTINIAVPDDDVGNPSDNVDEVKTEYNDNTVDSQKGEILDFNLLDKLNNTQYAWWIKLNKNHEPTTIPSAVNDMLQSHNGVYIGDTTKKVVYLTFDEGYENGYTPMILDTLKANDVKALFFVTGPYIKTYGNLVKRMVDEGHQVGNHSINHLSLPGLKDSSLENELYGLDKRFFALTGKHFGYMRPPRGEYSEKVLEAAKELGYKTVFWSYAYKDYDVKDQKGANHAYNMVMNNLHNGAIILLHAVSKDNAEALDRIIKDIKAQGYTISPFDL